MRKSATGIDYAVASGMIVMMIMMMIVVVVMMIVMMIMMMVKNDDTYHHLVVVDEYNDDVDTFIYYRKCRNRCFGLAIQARAQCWCW
jgi:flagellar basal body-associated protein FliL